MYYPCESSKKTQTTVQQGYNEFQGTWSINLLYQYFKISITMKKMKGMIREKE